MIDICSNKKEINDFEKTLYSDSIVALSTSDPKLHKLIKLIGNLELNSNRDYFASLLSSIVGQQLSAKAATTIRNRVKILCKGEMTPEILMQLPEDELRAAGLSRAKIEYIKDLSKKVNNKEIVFNDLCDLENDEIISILTGVKGIGKWTAEMFLIFALNRKNVMSYADAGLQRAARWLYDLPEIPKYNYLQQVESSWAPYKSIASLYLWESIDRGFVDSGKSLEDLYLQSIRNPD